MSAYAAMLRAVNVAGHNAVTMADLKSLCERLGYQDVKSLLQSGNVVFNAPGAEAAEIEAALERETQKRLHVSTQFFVRTRAQVAAAVRANPFGAQAEDDPARLVLVFLKSAAAASDVRALKAAISGPEQVSAKGNHVYAYYPDGQGRSKLTAKMIERYVKSVCTARNWNTVTKILEELKKQS
ncbi:MAG TPA: DUF1697 domain-containing protein [Candidatus Baltobacteraceae bacterium]|jgi:uncharacterized protein (DUF1697 family)|nr:DUF1697 domain-containing protein [Candidatus Baltobacteraceae bacterium]